MSKASNESERQVEAALFIAGRPITVKDIQDTQDIDPRTIRSALNKLEEKYSSEDSSIEIVKLGAKYAMQVKGKYHPKTVKLETPEIPKDVLKIASLIGFYQPILQSKLSALAGPSVYEGVKVLADRGLVKAKPKGRSVELTTTTKFIEYFGIDARSRVEVKHWFEKKLHSVPGKD